LVSVSKASNFGNSYIGMFAKSGEQITLIGAGSSPKFESALASLGTTLVRATFANSNLAGIYCALNSNGIVASAQLEPSERKILKKLGMNFYACKDKKSSMGNNLCANDKGAIANPYIHRVEIAKISECLGVEVAQMMVAGFETVGMACVATNKGFVAHNSCTEEGLRGIESVLKVKGLNATVNMGTAHVGLGLLATSKGCVVGDLTSGFEISRVQEGLDLI
jgi:translation initiation factor 6